MRRRRNETVEQARESAEMQEQESAMAMQGLPQEGAVAMQDDAAALAEAPELTPKARQTREHILTTALALFAEKGYASTTMRDIASKAGCSLGLAYRYFGAKEDLVLAMYARCAAQLAQEVAALPRGSLADRWYRAVQADIARLIPYRATMGALFGVALTPGSDIAVLGSRVSEIRETVWNALLQVITGATDAPKPRLSRELATLAYAAHLALILFWLQDTTPGQSATTELLKFAKQTLGRIRPFLTMPLVTRSLAQLAKILEPMFGAVISNAGKRASQSS
jgi:AcrR family transcriptional regulator